MTVCYFNDWLHKYFVILLLLKNYILTDENMNDALRSVNYLLINVLASSSVKTRRRIELILFSFGFLNVGFSFSEMYLYIQISIIVYTALLPFPDRGLQVKRLRSVLCKMWSVDQCLSVNCLLLVHNEANRETERRVYN